MSQEDSTPVAHQNASGPDIRLHLDPGEPISGTLTSQADSTRFCGWMELIAAITAARDAPR